MTFNMNTAFKMLGIVYGNYDGQKFVNDSRSTLAYAYSKFWIIFTIYDFFRFTALVFTPRSKHLYLEFYLCDYCSVIKSNSYKLMASCGPLFNVWLLAYFFIFQRINYSRKDSYWLKFFQIPITKTTDQLKLNSYPEEKLDKFWKFSSSIQNIFLKTLLINATSTMGLGGVSYLMMMWKYSQLLPPVKFWIILVLNYISLVAIGTMNLIMNIGLIIYLYLICKILGERFDIIRLNFNHLLQGRFNLEELKILLHDFNLVVDDLQKCNHFWSKFNFWNYHLAIVICSILFLICKFLIITLSMSRELSN